MALLGCDVLLNSRPYTWLTSLPSEEPTHIYLLPRATWPSYHGLVTKYNAQSYPHLCHGISSSTEHGLIEMTPHACDSHARLIQDWKEENSARTQMTLNWYI